MVRIESTNGVSVSSEYLQPSAGHAEPHPPQGSCKPAGCTCQCLQPHLQSGTALQCSMFESGQRAGRYTLPIRLLKPCRNRGPYRLHACNVVALPTATAHQSSLVACPMRQAMSKCHAMHEIMVYTRADPNQRPLKLDHTWVPWPKH